MKTFTILRGKNMPKFVATSIYLSHWKTCPSPTNFILVFELLFTVKNFWESKLLYHIAAAGDCWIVATFLSDSSAHDYDILQVFSKKYLECYFLALERIFLLCHTLLIYCIKAECSYFKISFLYLKYFFVFSQHHIKKQRIHTSSILLPLKKLSKLRGFITL